MKVSEAKTKVCPFMEVFIDVNSVAFETMDNKNSYCICGDCMAWEWYPKNIGTEEKPEWVLSDEGYCKRLGQ